MLPWKPLMKKQHLFLVNNKLYNPTLQKWYTGLGFSFCPILSKLQALGKLKTGTSHLKRMYCFRSNISANNVEAFSRLFNIVELTNVVQQC